MNNVLICGAGQVGFNLAKYLANNGYNVTVIDHNPDLIHEINERLDVKAVLGHASFPEVLQAAGADSTDMLIAVTQTDEVNMIACEVAYSLFHIQKRIARVRSQSYLNPSWSSLFAAEKISIDFAISPEVEVAQALTRGLSFPGAFDVVPFADGRLLLVGVHTTEETPVVNTPISHIGSLFPDIDLSVVGINHEGRTYIPSDKDIIMAGDDIYFIVPQEQIKASLLAFGYQKSDSRRLLILGGGNIGLCLAQQIETHYPQLRMCIVEKKPERAELIAQTLTSSTIICGDALESEILLEAGVENSDTVFAVTEDDRVNTLASLLSKRLGAKKVLSLVNKTSFGPLVTSLGVDAVISPRVVTVSKILQYIRRGQMLAVHSLGEDFGEVIEVNASMTNLVGQSVADINKLNHLMVAGILREEEVIIPTSNTFIKNEDRVVLMMSNEMVKETGKVLGIR
jgi:trk system potassium uptake protein TrkA